jgi:hypothetical protein
MWLKGDRQVKQKPSALLYPMQLFQSPLRAIILPLFNSTSQQQDFQVMQYLNSALRPVALVRDKRHECLEESSRNELPNVSPLIMPVARAHLSQRSGGGSGPSNCGGNI